MVSCHTRAAPLVPSIPLRCFPPNLICVMLYFFCKNPSDGKITTTAVMNLPYAPCSLHATGTESKHCTKQWFFRRHVDLVWGVEAYFYVGLGRFVSRPSSWHRRRTGLSKHQRRWDGGEPLCLYATSLEHQQYTRYILALWKE